MTPSELVNGRAYRIDRYDNNSSIHETGIFEGIGNKEGYLFRLSNDRMVYVHIRHIENITKKFETLEKIGKKYFGVVSLRGDGDMTRILFEALNEAYDEGRWQLQEEQESGETS